MVVLLFLLLQRFGVFYLPLNIGLKNKGFIYHALTSSLCFVFSNSTHFITSEIKSKAILFQEIVNKSLKGKLQISDCETSALTSSFLVPLCECFSWKHLTPYCFCDLPLPQMISVEIDTESRSNYSEWDKSVAVWTGAETDKKHRDLFTLASPFILQTDPYSDSFVFISFSPEFITSEASKAKGHFTITLCLSRWEKLINNLLQFWWTK